MKNPIIYLLAFSLSTMSAYAQIEIKTQPILVAVKTASLGLEYGLKPHLGVEVEYQRFQNNSKNIFAYTAHVGFIGLKYYFINDKDVALSNFYAGGYTSYMKGDSKKNTQTTPLTMYSFGGIGGYKGIFFNHLVLESGLNLGKRFIYEGDELAVATTPTAKFFYAWDVSLRLLVGYRF